MLSPNKGIVATLLCFGVAGVTLSVLGPKILGKATDIIVSGFVGGQLPKGPTRPQVIDQVQARGDTKEADFLQERRLHARVRASTSPRSAAYC